MQVNDPQHWNAIYTDTDEEALTWFQPRPDLSLDLILAHAPDGAVIDVGAGASRMADALVSGGRAVTVLDQSDEALAVTRGRLGAAADAVQFVTADITEWQPAPGAFSLWHDRAVFHFLIEDDQRAGYIAAMAAALAPGGVAIIAGFAPDGPERCSGLPVLRYTPEAIAAELARHAPVAFTLIDQRRHDHHTPKSRVQRFQYTVFRRA